MKLFDKVQTRDEYFETQIIRSKSKFQYCKVSYDHVKNWKSIIERFDYFDGPIVCLGTRNGREIDLFRTIFNGNKVLNFLVRNTEINRYGWNSLFPYFESFNRSNANKIDNSSVIGVEINPNAKRSDVHIGSFDQLPDNWENRFGVVYSNSFDQSQDPYKTAKEWVRVSKDKALIIIGFNDTEPDLNDPTGALTYEDFVKLFPGELLYFNKNGSNYSDIIIKLNK